MIKEASDILDLVMSIPERIFTSYLKSHPKKQSNIFYTNWVNQMEVLKHPKTKIFLSAGGLNSLYEAVEIGVPVIIDPIHLSAD